jgi:hypothetical protein
MRSQTEASSTKIMERVRVLGSLKVIKGPRYEAELQKQLNMSDVPSAELAELVEELISQGKLRSFDSTLDLGKGGIDNDAVTEEITVITRA